MSKQKVELKVIVNYPAAKGPFEQDLASPGETLAGYVVPSNYTGPFIPAGVYQSNLPYATRLKAPMDDFAPRIGFAWQPTSSGSCCN